MKHFTLLLGVALLALGSANALEQRTFYNEDRSKSFDAVLKAYDAKKKLVTVLHTSGKKASFPMSKLSEKCQEYVLSKKDALAIARYVRLDFEEIKAKRQGDAIPTHYNIEVYNRGKRPIQNVELRYTLYYKQGDLAKGGTAEKTSVGTLNTGKLFQNDTLMLSTQKINIVRTIKKPEGGG